MHSPTRRLLVQIRTRQHIRKLAFLPPGTGALVLPGQRASLRLIDPGRVRVEVLDRVHSQPDHVFGRAQPHLTRKRAGRRPHHTADRAAGDSLPLGGHGFTIGQVVEAQGFPGRSASANRAHSPQPTGQQPERAVQVLIDGIGLKGQIRASSLAQPGLVCRRLVIPSWCQIAASGAGASIASAPNIGRRAGMTNSVENLTPPILPARGSRLRYP